MRRALFAKPQQRMALVSGRSEEFANVPGRERGTLAADEAPIKQPLMHSSVSLAMVE